MTVIRSEIEALSAYSVPDISLSEGPWIKLDAMENPYPLPPSAQEALAQALGQLPLHRYPAPSYRALKETIVATQDLGVGVLPEQLVLGNGSDELISLLCIACARPNAVVVAPTPSFVMYEMSAQFAGLSFVGVPLQADFGLDCAAMLVAIRAHRPALLFLAYPNNPTGNLFEQADIEALVEAMAGVGLVVLDEAYYPFAQQSWFARCKDFPHLVVIRTLSKLGLAGIRLGFMSGARMSEFNKVRPPYNVNRLTEAAALTLLPMTAMWEEQIAAIRTARQALYHSLEAWRSAGIEVFTSQANFFLIRLPPSRPEADQVAEAFCHYCFEQRILIKNLSRMPALARCVRVTVGTPLENQAFLRALQTYFELPV